MKKIFIKLRKLSTALAVISLFFTYFILPVQASEFYLTKLDISELRDNKIIFQWQTNEQSQSWLQIGLEPQKFKWTISSRQWKNSHQASFLLPYENTTYYYRVVAEDQSQQRIKSFTLSFKVKEFSDNIPPIFSKLPRLLYSNNKEAFLVWQTNEPTQAEIRYGLNSDLTNARLARTSSDKNKDNYSKIKLQGLIPNATYYYQVIISDKQKNLAKTATLSWQMKSQPDLTKLKLLNQRPLSDQDTLVEATNTSLSWQTSRPSICEVSYGQKNKNHKKIKETLLESLNHLFEIEELVPDSLYIYKISCRDILGNKYESGDIQFQTKKIIVKGYTNIEEKKSVFYGQQYKLVKSAEKPQIYVVVKNQKYPIKSIQQFVSYGFKWSDVKTISQNQLDKYPLAKLLKSPDSPGVYFIYYNFNRKKSILTEEAFRSYPHNNFSQVIIVNPSDLGSITDIVLIKTINQPDIYLVQGNIKRPIKDQDALLANNLDSQPIGIVSKKDLDSYYTGKILTK